MEPALTAPERYVTVPEFRRRLGGVSVSTLYRMMDAGDIARPSKITRKRVGWPIEYVDRFMLNRLTPEQAAAVQ